MKILVVGAEPRTLINFRGPLIRAMLAEGHEVSAAANGREPGTEAKLQQMGVSYYPIHIAHAGLNPLVDITTLLDLIRLIRRIKPDLVFSYTIKPVIYGGLAARFCGVKNIFSMIEGLGYAFMPWDSLIHVITSIIAKNLYRVGLLSSRKVFFLNPDDLEQFIKEGYVSRHRAVLLNGIGIDLEYFKKEQLSETSIIRFLMIARLIKDKGVREYINAARNIRARYQHVEFVLAGDLDQNPNSIRQEELDLWLKEGTIKYAGFIDDVRPLHRDCHVFILPSFYREGVPRTTLESMATGRAVITTDSTGCRETVNQAAGASGERIIKEGAGNLKFGRNGILVPVKDVDALVAAIEFFIDHPEQIEAMGRESRAYARERYDVHKVNARILQEMGLIDNNSNY